METHHALIQKSQYGKFYSLYNNLQKLSSDSIKMAFSFLTG